MKIALDYDDTFTADPDLWMEFVASAKARGHEVTFVTFRYAGPYNGDIEIDAQRMEIPIVFCGQKQKASCYQADIWIDDRPEWIPVAEMGLVGILRQRGQA